MTMTHYPDPDLMLQNMEELDNRNIRNHQYDEIKAHIFTLVEHTENAVVKEKFIRLGCMIATAAEYMRAIDEVSTGEADTTTTRTQWEKQLQFAMTEQAKALGPGR